MGSTLKKKRLPKKQVEIQISNEQAQVVVSNITAIHEYFRDHIRDDRIDVLLDLIIQLTKEESKTNRDLFQHCGPVKWAKEKIIENRIALRLLRAYKKDPIGLAKAATVAENSSTFLFGVER